MLNVAELAAWGGIILLAGFFGLVFWKLMTGGISLDYLLYGDARTRHGASHSTFFSPGRAQMLMFTVLAAMYFLLQVIQDPTKFPDVPNALLAILGGSHILYLGGKAQALYLGRLRNLAALPDRRNP
jgi:hypothetical protein